MFTNNFKRITANEVTVSYNAPKYLIKRIKTITAFKTLLCEVTVICNAVIYIITHKIENVNSFLKILLYYIYFRVSKENKDLPANADRFSTNSQ